MFKTRRTTLQACTPEDVRSCLSFLNDPLIQSAITTDPIVPCTDDNFTAKIEGALNEALLYVIIEVTNPNTINVPYPGGGGSYYLKVIGAASITTTHVKNRDVSFSIFINPNAWNRGFATEVTTFLVDYAFKNLAVHRISLDVLDNNPWAIKAFKKVGFTEEGRKRKANFFNGKWQDSIYMGILEEEWFAKSEAVVLVQSPRGNV